MAVKKDPVQAFGDWAELHPFKGFLIGTAMMIPMIALLGWDYWDRFHGGPGFPIPKEGLPLLVFIFYHAAVGVPGLVVTVFCLYWLASGGPSLIPWNDSRSLASQRHPSPSLKT